MAKKKNNNSRKALAVALGIMGVAGLSLASAAQLTVNTTNEVGIGSDVFAACQTSAIEVRYDYDANYNLTNLILDSIDAQCVTDEADVNVVLEYTRASNGTEDTFTDSVAAAAGELSIPVTGIEVADDLGEITIVIG